ncbi:MAG: universal stress protein [Calditrichaeota bacterium]|nr:MAG: universal stress protein [Calditrichota bacterium]
MLTIREQEDPAPADALHRILVPIDFSDHSRSAIAYASEVAKLFGAKLQFLHVVEETIHPAFYATGKVSIFELVADLKDRTQRAMQKLRDELVDPKIETEYHVTEGRAARDISKFAAEHDSDMIVISTHGLTGIEHLLLGSVAEKVVRMAPCPVLTVKSFGKSLL